MKSRIAAALLVIAAALPGQADDVTSRIEALVKPYEATVGVAATDTMTGRKILLRADERFPMGSVYKLPIVMALLRKTNPGDVHGPQATPAALTLDTDITIAPKDFSPGHSPLAEEAGKQPVTEPLGSLVMRALRDSDNTASDALLRTLGGPQAVMAYLKFIGVRDIDVSRSEKQLAADIAKKGDAAYWADPRDTATPSAMTLLMLYDEKAHGLDTASQQFVKDMLLHTDTALDRIRAGVPPGAKVLEKSGTMPGVVNDVAVIYTVDENHRIILSIFTKGWKTTPDAERARLIADITKEVVAGLTAR